MSEHSFFVQETEVHLEGRGHHTVVMLHGWPDSHHLWDGMVQTLSPFYRCARFTLPGFGSAPQAKPRSLAQMTEHLLAIVDTLSPQQPVTLLMHDWGCVFGYELALRHPNRVARVVAIDIGDHNSGAYARSLTTKEKLQIGGYQLWLAGCWALGMLGAEGLANTLTRRMARAMRCLTDEQRIHWRMNLPYAMAWLGAAGGLRGTLPVRPKCPIYYAWGTRKPFMFHSSRWLETLARNPANVAQAYRSGHWVMLDQAQALQSAVRDWLQAQCANGPEP